MKVLVTGGAGFIGSAVCRHLVSDLGWQVVNVDKLTYAADLRTLTSIEDSPAYAFEQVDVCDGDELKRVFASHDPDAVMHLAAESHVDRSIDGPGEFIQTNLVGTYTLLEEALRHWQTMPEPRKANFRFHQVSTDEVYGSLGSEGLFTEETAYAPNSPYAASKAGADHLVRAWWVTYGLPIVISNCSNNYGPYQFPEKLIPLMILNIMHGRPLPVYGDGSNTRDWLYVEDHASALGLVLKNGKVGEKYNVGGDEEMTNIELVRALCILMDELCPDKPVAKAESLITFVTDRPGHDLRYAIDASKMQKELGWNPRHNFSDGLRSTVEWYLANEAWWRPILDSNYDGERLGIG